MSLLSKAKLVPVAKLHTRSEANIEIIELAIAYAKHEVTMKQAATALEMSITKAASRIQHALFSAVRTGELVSKR